MGKISRKEIRHVATLARLDLGSQEEERLAVELGQILAHFEKLNELDTEGVEPTAYLDEASLAMRKDEVTNPPAEEDLLAGAPAREGRFFKVPPIIE